jgi:predicted nucleotidyltransferase
VKGQELTPFPELDAVLKDHADRLKHVLGDLIVAIYVQGSLAIGDFDMTSDVDLIVVTGTELTPEQALIAQAVHTETYRQNNRWSKRLEYSFFPIGLLKSPSSPFGADGRPDSEGRELWYFDNGSPLIERSDHDNSLVVRWTLRERSVAISGPAPATLVDPVTPEDLRTEIQLTLVGWGDMVVNDPEPYRNRFYQSFLVLNYCRGLLDLTEGSIHSKLAGVTWARQNLQDTWTPLINFCWEERQDPDISIKQPADPEIFRQTIEFVRYAVDCMRDLEGSQG